MKRSIAFGAAALGALYLFSLRDSEDGFRYDIGGAARAILKGQAAVGFHPCGLGFAVERRPGRKYAVRLYDLDGFDRIPGPGLQPLRVASAPVKVDLGPSMPGGPASGYITEWIAPGVSGYSGDLKIQEFDSVVEAANAIQLAAGQILQAQGSGNTDVGSCVSAPAVAVSGKISASGITSEAAWLGAGGFDPR